VPTAVFRDEVRTVLEEGAQLVDVLPREEYEDDHLPNAINIPLRELDRETRAQLSRGSPVIVYCHAVRHEPAGRVAARTCAPTEKLGVVRRGLRMLALYGRSWLAHVATVPMRELKDWHRR
jgi:hypothetical protein